MEGGEGDLEIDCVVGGGGLDGVGFEDGILGLGSEGNYWMKRARGRLASVLWREL